MPLIITLLIILTAIRAGSRPPPLRSEGLRVQLQPDLGDPVLYYTILYYTIIYYTILYYTMLYYTILYYTIAPAGVPELRGRRRRQRALRGRDETSMMKQRTKLT